MDEVLFIDDDENILNFATKLLCHLGYEVKIAHDGEEGIELLRKNHGFKVVITDITMPKKNGNQVAKYIRDNKKIHDTPIFAITGLLKRQSLLEEKTLPNNTSCLSWRRYFWRRTALT